MADFPFISKEQFINSNNLEKFKDETHHHTDPDESKTKYQKTFSSIESIFTDHQVSKNSFSL